MTTGFLAGGVLGDTGNICLFLLILGCGRVSPNLVGLGRSRVSRLTGAWELQKKVRKYMLVYKYVGNERRRVETGE